MSEELQYSVRLADGTAFGPAPMATLRQWATERRIPANATIVPANGQPPWPAADDISLKPLLVPVAPPTHPGEKPQETEAPGIFPYKNPQALTGYYLAVFSLIPVVGFLLAVPAFILGIRGYRVYRREPQRKGHAHAWVAMILGGVTMLAWGAVVVLMIVAAVHEASR